MTIRKAKLTDIITLQEIGKLTFAETFASVNNEQDMEKYLKTEFSIEKLSNELSDENSSFYFVELDQNVIGYLKVNFGQAQTEIKDNSSLEIERIYVLKEFHGKKAGQILYEKAIDLAKENKLKYVWLGVWEENPRAIKFYEKNGFIPFDKHIFKLGTDEQTDIMMKLEITSS